MFLPKCDPFLTSNSDPDFLATPNHYNDVSYRIS